MPQWTLSAMPSSSVKPEGDGNIANCLLAAIDEFDTVQSGHGDVNDNHIVGIHINSMNSSISKPAPYYTNSTDKESILKLDNGEISQAWVKSNGFTRQLQVTISPLQVRHNHIVTVQC